MNTIPDVRDGWIPKQAVVLEHYQRHATGVHVANPFTVAEQRGRGYRLRPDGDHIHEYTDSIIQAVADLEAGVLNMHDFDFYAVGDAPQAILDLIEPDPFAAPRAAFAGGVA